MQRSAKSRATLPSSSIGSSRLRAMTGSCTLSSKLPRAAPHATAASLPMTWVATWSTASHRTGFTLPGMIELPGWRSGRCSSPRPADGPEPIQRMSSAHFVRATATTRTQARQLDEGVARRVVGDVVGGLGEAAGRSPSPAGPRRRRRSPAGTLMPVPTALPPRGSSPTRGRASPRGGPPPARPGWRSRRAPGRGSPAWRP